MPLVPPPRRPGGGGRPQGSRRRAVATAFFLSKTIANQSTRRICKIPQRPYGGAFGIREAFGHREEGRLLPGEGGGQIMLGLKPQGCCTCLLLFFGPHNTQCISFHSPVFFCYVVNLVCIYPNLPPNSLQIGTYSSLRSLSRSCIHFVCAETLLKVRRANWGLFGNTHLLFDD